MPVKGFVLHAASACVCVCIVQLRFDMWQADSGANCRILNGNNAFN